jgi:DNA-binding response OmpR family regulator
VRDAALAPLIFVVEDEPIIGYEVESTLVDAGYRVLGPLRSRKEALDNLDDEAIALAVVDLVLTDGPGEEIVEALLERGVPVIVTSGLNAQDGLKDRCAGWFVKPYDPDRLVSRIKALLPLIGA